MGFVEDLAAKIAQFEGFYNTGPPNPSQRNNNPGNLVEGTGQIGHDAQGYAIFPSVDVGWAALYRQIGLYADRGLSLTGMMNIYAPPSVGNPTSNYINFLSSGLGIDPSLPIAQYIDAGGPAGPSPPADFRRPATSPPPPPGSTSEDPPAEA